MHIYLASSWRNEKYPEVLEALREAGHEVYDFRQGRQLEAQAWWAEERRGHTFEEMRAMHTDPRNQEAYRRDWQSLQDCDALVCVLPCGRSAHLELGVAIGQNKPTCIVWQDGDEPDIMHKAAFRIVDNPDDLLDWCAFWDNRMRVREVSK